MKSRIFSKRYLIFLFLSIPLTLAVFVMFYASYKAVNSRNKLKQDVASIASRNFLDKIDRNFYERFGDVQAFAYNRLAIQAVQSDSSTEELQQFINTMTSYYVLYDLMMVCDLNGNILAVNTKEKTGKTIHPDFLIGKNIAKEEWFKVCTSANGPEGGAWYSDFTINKDVKALDNDNNTGWGMAFAAPIKNDNGVTLGVWYNFASWYEVTMKIRQQVESELREDNPGTIVILINNKNEIIDADDSVLVASAYNLNTENLVDGSLVFNGQKLSLKNYESAYCKSKGAYTYKGKEWSAIVLIPEERFSVAHIFTSDNASLLIVVCLFLAGAAFLAVSFSQRVTKSINTLSQVVVRLSEGELAESNIESDDEIGTMAKAIDTLAKSLKDKVKFAENIGKGNFGVNYQPVGEKDILGHSLVEMRNSLALSAAEDKKRNWVTEGLALFGNLLRTNTDMQQLYDNFLKELVKYLGANQGAIFILKKEDNVTKYLEMVACYAYDRKKFLHKTIQLGKGLAGQSVLEKDFIYLTEVPANYVEISSGLGEARPRCIIVMPLIMNEEVVGVIELAFFNPLPDHYIEFLQKVSENIASVVVTAQMNETTQRLLEDSQQITEEMRAQEEEMRQNMEELNATQEELHRKTLDQERQLEEQKSEFERKMAFYEKRYSLN